MNGIRRDDKRLPLGIIIIVVIVIAALSASKPVQMDWTETGEETGTAFSAMITAYNDGEPVGEPIVMAGYERGGLPIDSFVIAVTWTSTGTGDIDWSTFSLTGSFKVSFLNEYDNYIKEYETSITSFEPSATWSKTLVLGTDICKIENMVYGGWFLEFRGSMTGTVDTIAGLPLSDTITLPPGTVFVDYTTEFNLSGGWDY